MAFDVKKFAGYIKAGNAEKANLYLRNPESSVGILDLKDIDLHTAEHFQTLSLALKNTTVEILTVDLAKIDNYHSLTALLQENPQITDVTFSNDKAWQSIIASEIRPYIAYNNSLNKLISLPEKHHLMQAEGRPLSLLELAFKAMPQKQRELFYDRGYTERFAIHSSRLKKPASWAEQIEQQRSQQASQPSQIETKEKCVLQ